MKVSNVYAFKKLIPLRGHPVLVAAVSRHGETFNEALIFLGYTVRVVRIP